VKPLSWYRETYIKDGYRCVYCGRDMLADFDSWMSIELDHIVPVSAGGGDELENRVTSCHVCNRFKSGYVPENYTELQPSEILHRARLHVLALRVEWQAKFFPAVEEYWESSRDSGDF
jgi:5-methylcytosine-specific restriction endonuclease McrA